MSWRLLVQALLALDTVCFKPRNPIWLKLTIHLGAVRIEHQFYELGQACANACDIALNDVGTQGSVQDVPYSVLRERLLDQEAVLDVSLVGKPDFSLL